MSAPFGKKSSLQTKLLWTAVVILGVVSFGIVALNRGETRQCRVAGGCGGLRLFCCLPILWAVRR